jgi:hypothetical protein
MWNEKYEKMWGGTNDDGASGGRGRVIDEGETNWGYMDYV